MGTPESYLKENQLKPSNNMQEVFKKLMENIHIEKKLPMDLNHLALKQTYFAIPTFHELSEVLLYKSNTISCYTVCIYIVYYVFYTLLHMDGNNTNHCYYCAMW